MKYYKMLALAVIAASAFVVFVNPILESSSFAGMDGSPSLVLALGVLCISVSTLGATALRLGKSAITTNETAATTVTGTVTNDSSVQLSISQKDRYAPPFISVMVC